MTFWLKNPYREGKEMPIIATKGSGKDYPQVSAGMVQGVLYDIWDIGIQVGEYEGKPLSKHQVIFAFEVDEMHSDGELQGKRMTISKFYTLSLHEKASLRKDVECWRGKALTPAELEGFDLESLIGMNCILNVIHGENKKSRIASISPLMKGNMPMKPENKRVTPEWVQKFMDKSEKNDGNYVSGEDEVDG